MNRQFYLLVGITFFKSRFPKLTDDELFLLWFLHAYLVDDETAAAKAIVRAPNNNGVDAVYIDDKARIVFIVQGKLRHVSGQRLERRDDVIPFARLGFELWGDKASFDEFCIGLDPIVRDKLKEARERLTKRKYRLRLYYASLGRFDYGLRDEVKRIGRRADGQTEIVLLDDRETFVHLIDYLQYVVPPTGPLELQVKNGGSGRSLSDVIATNRQQLLIEQELRKVSYQYLLKRLPKSEAKRAASPQYRFFVTKEELAQAVAACRLDPAVVQEGIENLFKEQYYRSVFKSVDADYYLSRYWLMKRVELAARGYPERAYAKWLVLHFVWGVAGREIGRKAKRFREACERPSIKENKQIVDALDKAINTAFLTALEFCKENRGDRCSQSQESSTFFQHRGLYKQFDSFWKDDANRRRSTFDRAATRFVQALRA